MVQALKRKHSLNEIHAAAGMYAEIAARLDAIAVSARQVGMQGVDLKLGTLTGSMFTRMRDSLDKVEADARISIRNHEEGRT